MVTVGTYVCCGGDLRLPVVQTHKPKQTYHRKCPRCAQKWIIVRERIEFLHHQPEDGGSIHKERIIYP